MTKDVDIAQFTRLSVALNDVTSPSLPAIFRDLKFEALPSLDPYNRVWRWAQSPRGTQVEFLTPSFAEDEGLRHLSALGVSARALHYLDFLIAGPIPAASLYRSGVLVQIPRPERYAIHKLIVADRRSGRDAQKAEKDRRQAAFLIGILAQDRPDELAEAYATAHATGPRWRAHLGRTLERLPGVAAQLAGVGAAIG